MFIRKVLLSILTAGLLLTGTGTLFAQQYYNGYYYPQPNYYNNNNYNQGYYGNPGYQPVASDPYYYSDPYNQQYYQNSNYYDGTTRATKIKKVLTYSAIGAGAGYFLARDGNKKKTALTGAGIGAALGLLLGR